MLIEQALILLCSLLVLTKSAQIINDNAVKLARFFKISEAAIGFVLLSVATSLPELAIGVLSGLKHESAISVGNVLGANISDLTLVIGASALFGTVVFSRKETKKLANMLFLASIIPVTILFLNYGKESGFLLPWLFAAANSFLGIILLCAFVWYALVVLKEEIAEEYGEKVPAKDAVFAGLWFSFGVGVLLASSNYVVDSAVNLATILGVAKSVVAATIISIGTTLPELTVTVLAVKSGKKEMGMGNAIGSCIVNLTLILGAGAVINPLAASLLPFSMLVAFYLFSIFVLWILIKARAKLGKKEAGALLALYAFFLLASSKIAASAG